MRIYIKKKGSQQMMKVVTMTAIVRAAFLSFACDNFAFSLITFCMTVSSPFGPASAIKFNLFIETAAANLFPIQLASTDKVTLSFRFGVPSSTIRKFPGLICTTASLSFFSKRSFSFTASGAL